MFLKLPDMRQFMPYPFPVIDEFLHAGIVQQDRPAQHHGHFILFQLARCQPGQERIFFDIIFHDEALSVVVTQTGSKNTVAKCYKQQ